MSAPLPNTIRLPAPDQNFRLTAEERASVRPGFDVDALERLLAAIEPGARPIVLESFQQPTPGGSVANTIKMGDPALQPLLDEVWAPVWERRPAWTRKHVPDVAWPGRELARKRLDEREGGEQE